MNIERTKPLVHGHQLRGQSGQLFLVMRPEGALCLLLYQTMFRDRAIGFYKHKAASIVPVFHSLAVLTVALLKVH